MSPENKIVIFSVPPLYLKLKLKLQLLVRTTGSQNMDYDFQRKNPLLGGHTNPILQHSIFVRELIWGPTFLILQPIIFDTATVFDSTLGLVVPRTFFTSVCQEMPNWPVFSHLAILLR